MGYVTQKKMYAERARATGNLDAIAIRDGEKKPVTKEELERHDYREYLAGLLEGLTGKYVSEYGKRKATLIKEILIKQEEILRDATMEVTEESKEEKTMPATTDKSKEEATKKKETLEEIEETIKGKKTRQEVEEYLQGLTVKMVKEMYRAMYVNPCGEWYRQKKAELIEELTEYYMPPESEEEELDDLLPDVMGYVHGQAIRRSPDDTEASIEEEAMEREVEGIKKLCPDERELELEAQTRAELDYMCREFWIKVISEAPKEEKRQKLLKYLDEVDGGKREKEGSDSKVA